jgi:hypothetical protein
MNCHRIVAIILLVTSLLKGAVAIAETTPTEVKKVVTFIFPADAQGNLMRDPKTNNPIPYGTGFFVGVKSDDGNGFYGYLVTAKHVVKDFQGKDFNRIYLRLNKQQGDAEFVALDLSQSDLRVVYTHTDPSVDIAVVPALPPQAIYDFKVIPEDMISTKATFDEFNIAEGSDIFFTGLFTNVLWGAQKQSHSSVWPGSNVS